MELEVDNMELIINENPPEEPTYKVGDLVLGRITGFPFWPAEVTGLPEENSDQYRISFFPAASAEIAFVGLTQIKTFDEEQRDKMQKAKKLKLSKTNAVKWDLAVKEISERLSGRSNGIPESAQPSVPNTDKEMTNGDGVSAQIQQQNAKTPNRKRRISITEDDEKPVEAAEAKLKRKKTDIASRPSSTNARSSRVTRRSSAAAEADGELSELDKSIDTSLYTTAVDSSVLDSSVAEEPSEIEINTPRGRSNRVKSLPRKFLDPSITLSERTSHALASEQAKLDISNSNADNSKPAKQTDQVNGENTEDAPEPDSSVIDPVPEPSKRQAPVRRKFSQGKGKGKQKVAPGPQNGDILNQEEIDDLDASAIEEPASVDAAKREENSRPEFVSESIALASTKESQEKSEVNATVANAAAVQVGKTAETSINSGVARFVVEEIPVQHPEEPAVKIPCMNIMTPPEAEEHELKKEEESTSEVGSVPIPAQDMVDEISASFLDIAKAQVSVAAPVPLPPRGARGRRSLKDNPVSLLKGEPAPVDDLQPEKSPSEPGLSLSMESPPGSESQPSGHGGLDAAIPKELDPPSASSTPAEAPAAVRNRRNTTVPLRLQDTVNPVTKTAYSLSAAGKKSKKDLNLSQDGQLTGATSKRELNGKDSEERTPTDEKRMKMLEDCRDIMEACLNLMDATCVESHDFEEALEMIGILTDKEKITKEILTTYPVIVEILKKLQYFSGNSSLKFPKRIKIEMPQKIAEIRRAAREGLDIFKEMMATNTKPAAVLLMEQMMATQKLQE